MTDKFSTINMTDIEFYNIQKEDLSDALTNYILILCYNYAVAGIVGFNHRREPYIDFVCEHLCIRANKKSYGISLHYGCDDFSINEFVEIFKKDDFYITITDSEYYNRESHPLPDYYLDNFYILGRKYD